MRVLFFPFLRAMSVVKIKDIEPCPFASRGADKSAAHAEHDTDLIWVSRGIEKAMPIFKRRALILSTRKDRDAVGSNIERNVER